MGRYAGRLAAAGGQMSQRTPLGRYMAAMSRVRDGELAMRGHTCLNLLKATGGTVSLSSPLGRAALRQSIAALSVFDTVNTEASLIENNRSPVARWFQGSTDGLPEIPLI